MIEYLLVDLVLDMPLDEGTDPAATLELLREIVREADEDDPLAIVLVEYHPALQAESMIEGVEAIEAHLAKRVEARRKQLA
jgi:hypothetical protein